MVGGYPIQTFKHRFQNLWAMFDKCSMVFADMHFLKQDQIVLSYGQAKEKSLAMAAYFKNQAGVGKGDNIAILMENSIRFIIAFWAIQRLGATAVILNTRLAPPELKRQLEFSDIKLLVSSPTLEPKIKEIPSLSVSFPQIILGEDWQSKLPAGGIQGDMPEILEDDTAVILFTSGTSGPPKGVMITHRNFITSAIKLLLYNRPYEDPGQHKVFIAAPLFHVLALQGQMILAVISGRCCVLVPAFNPKEALEIIIREQIAVMAGSPTMFWMLLHKTDIRERKVDSLRVIGYGGAPMPPDLIAEIRKTFPGVRCANGYGLTEASVMARLGDEFCETHPTSVGQPTICSEIKIVDPLTDKELGPHSEGEVAVKGALVSKGYYKSPEETAKVYRQGWFHTGDMGYKDSEGFLYLVGRLTEMINRGGENVYPVEVENVLHLHPKILDCSVFGLPDPVMGSVVAVAAVPRSLDDTLSVNELKEFCKGQLADYKIPSKIFITLELPRNPGGKVMKKELVNQYK